MSGSRPFASLSLSTSGEEGNAVDSYSSRSIQAAAQSQLDLAAIQASINDFRRTLMEAPLPDHLVEAALVPSSLAVHSLLTQALNNSGTDSQNSISDLEIPK